jgi:phage-related protein
MKPLDFLGDSKKQLVDFPEDAQQKIGYQLERVQSGFQPSDSKAMLSIGPGVEEIRVWVESGTYRVIYIARMPEAVYVLHAFAKKTQQTSQKDLDLAKSRLARLRRKS